MFWVLNKIDLLLGASIAACAAMAASQTQAIIDQYVQRLGGHLDEARLNLDRIVNGVRYQTMSEAVRSEIETDARLRVEELNTAYTAIVESGVVTRPLVFLRHADDAILTATLSNFVPAIPLDANALIYSFIGIVIALIVYETVKLPLKIVIGQPRRRRFKKRGSMI